MFPAAVLTTQVVTLSFLFCISFLLLLITTKLFCISFLLSLITKKVEYTIFLSIDMTYAVCLAKLRLQFALS